MVGQRGNEWQCETCGHQHQGLATVFGAQAPDVWLQATSTEREAGELTGDMCLLEVGGERHYFLRGPVEIPLIDAPGEVFSWSAWVSLSQESIQKIADHWDDPARASMPPVFGWLCNELPYDQPTTSIATHVHNREPGVVPYIELDPFTDHPLVREQASGISLHRLAEINKAVMG
ncbi:DUF2199 domain-containing protein [Paenarthrobacter sp. NEAU-H11]|uniref:DUF2199 domain-containing protein n=1 Tax=Paenarthrobacter sp. NEAU-H11 TaxID=3423924 RepID=UPI003D33743B